METAPDFFQSESLSESFVYGNILFGWLVTLYWADPGDDIDLIGYQQNQPSARRLLLVLLFLGNRLAISTGRVGPAAGRKILHSKTNFDEKNSTG